MTAGEYVSAFASIILALAVTDLATSIHRLLRARKRVRWDWLPLAVALQILFAAVQFWWVFFEIWSSTSRFALGWFLPDLVTLLLLFLIASAALPDEVPTQGLDLEGYYFENCTYFWSLFALLVVSTTASGILHRATSAATASDVMGWILQSGNVTLLVFSAVLIATKRRWVHTALVLFMFAALVWQWVALTIAD
jgi:hypothetical protein